MLFLFPSFLLHQPLTEARLHAIVRAAHDTLLYRCDHVYGRDRTGCAFHVSLCEDLKTWDAQAFITALYGTLALRVEKLVLEQPGGRLCVALLLLLAQDVLQRAIVAARGLLPRSYHPENAATARWRRAAPPHGP